MNLLSIASLSLRFWFALLRRYKCLAPAVVFFNLLIPVPLQAGIVFDPALRDTLTARALSNLEPLPGEIAAVYQSFLDQYPDPILAYQIGSERSATLWNADPQDLLSNYQHIQQLLEQEEFDYSPEFFLAYIAKITVGNERLTPYRELFAREGLLEFIAEYPDLLERIRAVNLWCREHMVFVSTSGRTQDPISVLQKSNIGRCGEMQVFFISACRTVGIPARPAWTPWWPHTDNNHAWTEVYVDGAWHYVENAQSDYHLDSTWFTGTVNKALLVLARSSFPDSLDDVVSEGKDISRVNSTRYYQRTRNIAFAVIDAENNPVSGRQGEHYGVQLLDAKAAAGDRGRQLRLGQGEYQPGEFPGGGFQDSLFDYVANPL